MKLDEGVIFEVKGSVYFQIRRSATRSSSRRALAVSFKEPITCAVRGVCLSKFEARALGRARRLCPRPRPRIVLSGCEA